ncbi:unnamed protein product, partial [Choristocarpus tenellus]
STKQVVYTPDGTRLLSCGSDGLLCLYNVGRGYQPVRMLACDPPAPGSEMSLTVSPGSDRVAVLGPEPTCILLYDLASLVLRKRLGRPERRGPGEGSYGGGMGIGAGLDRVGSGGGWQPQVGAWEGQATAAWGGVGAFLHASFSGDGSDLMACTRSKLFRFPLRNSSRWGVGGTNDIQVWSALLPCKVEKVVSLLPPQGPGLLLASPAPAPVPVPGAGPGGGRSLVGKALVSASELCLCQVHRDISSASVVLSMPQVFAAHSAPLSAAAFSRCGTHLVTCDASGVVLLWSNLASPDP